MIEPRALTCEKRRRTAGVATSAEPAVVPVPPAAVAATETEEVPQDVRVAQNRPGKFKPSDAECVKQPFERHLTLFLEKTLADLGVEADTLDSDVPHKLLLPIDNRFAFFEAVLEEHFCEIDFGQSKRSGILSFFARETIAVLRTAPNRDAFANKLGGVERLGTVDEQNARTLHDEVQAVVQKGFEAPINFFVRASFETFLDGFAIDSIGTQVQKANADVLQLRICCGFHYRLLDDIRCTTLSPNVRGRLYVSAVFATAENGL